MPKLSEVTGQQPAKMKLSQAINYPASVDLVMPDGSSATKAGERLMFLDAERQRYSPTQGMSFGGKAAAGLGKSVVDTGRGVQQIAGYRTPEQVEEDRRIDAPLMRTGGGVLGNVSGQIAQTSIPLGRLGQVGSRAIPRGAVPYVSAAGRGGAFSATQPVGVGESRAENTAQGAALGAGGQAVASGTKALSAGAASRMDAASKALALKADQMGIRLGVPQLSENPMVRTVASQLERLPFSGAGGRGKSNQVAFNRQVSGEYGAQTDKITPDKFAAAKQDLQDTFETLSSRNDLVPDQSLGRNIADIQNEATRLGGSDTARMVSGWVDELFSKADANGVIPGKAYQSFDSRIGKVIKTGGEPGLYLGRLRDAVRETMDNSISAGDRAAWNKVRKQYAVLKTVEPLVAKSADGNISPTLLMGRLTSGNANVSRMATGGAGKLGDLARIGQKYLKDAPNSGTADRLLVNGLLGGTIFGAQQTGVIDPQTAMLTAGALFGNRLAGKALNSRALTFGDSASLNGLARLMKPAPRLLPASPALGGLFIDPEQVR
jgi:hypothetical protein